MATQRPRVSVRFDAKAQLERITRAAKLRKWTINQFMIEASDREAVKLLTTEKSSEQLTVKTDLPSLNQ